MTNKKRRIIKSLKEMKVFAAKFAKMLKGGEVLALVGDLGAGKTSFVQALAKALGVKAVVQSPTFLLMKCYPVVLKAKSSNLKALCHIDAYRIKTSRELINIGAGEKIGDPETVTAIEWADRVKDILPKNAIVIKFAHGKNNDERIVVVNTKHQRTRAKARCGTS